MTGTVPKSVARRLVTAAQAERRAAAKLDEARARLAHELALAQSEGYSVRMLADVVEWSPTQTYRLMQEDAA